MVKEIVSICTIGILATSCQSRKEVKSMNEATNDTLTMLVVHTLQERVKAYIPIA